MKTTAQIGVAAGALFASSAIGLGSVYYFIHQIRDDVRVVNTAGIVRGASQRLVKLELAGQKSDELIGEIDGLIRGLIDGDESLKLPAATDPEVLAKNQAIADSWENLKTIILDFRENPSQRNLLIQESESHWDITNQGVFTAETWSEKKVAQSQNIFFIIFSINLCCLILILWGKFRIEYKLKKIIKTISRSANEMAAVVTEQEAITGQQAIAVNQTSHMIGELKNLSHYSVKQAIQINQNTSEVNTLVQSGKNTEEYILSDLASLNKKVKELQTKIMELRQQTQQIANISQLVNELANHSDILALNASMEAIRAGEKGKEFALVAREIRKLSHQSKKAAEKIYSLVADIETSMKTTVLVTNESCNSVSQEVNKTTEMLKVFEKVVNAIDPVFTSSKEITLTAQQQAEIIQQALAEIEEINRAAQESAYGMSHAKNGMEQLKEVVSHLDAIV